MMYKKNRINPTLVVLFGLLLGGCGSETLSGSFGLTPSKFQADSITFNQNSYKHKIQDKLTNEVIYEHNGTYEIENGDIILCDFFLNFPEEAVTKNTDFELLRFEKVLLPIIEYNENQTIIVNQDMGVRYTKL